MPIKNKTLSTHAIDVYTIKLDDVRQHCDEYLKLLPLNEQKDLENFANLNLKQNALLSKALTRLILSKYLNIAPKEIPIIRTHLKKPSLPEELKSYQFNVSHTKTYFALAITKDAIIGIDIEHKNLRQYQDISQRFFHPKEHESLMNSKNQEDCFFRIWTQKEAFVKAIGEGLSFDLKKFYVDLNEAKIIHIDDPNYKAETFHSHLMQLPEQHYLCITTTKPLTNLNILPL